MGDADTIDDLSRELSEEIEAHRVTRVRAVKAEARVEELEAKLEGSAADDAFDAIAALLGCPSWDYPGQLVRDVKALKAECAHWKDLYECYSSGCDREQSRKEAAEQRLADLVREVREWIQSTDEAPRAKHWTAIDGLLARYELPPEVQP